MQDYKIGDWIYSQTDPCPKKYIKNHRYSFYKVLKITDKSIIFYTYDIIDAFDDDKYHLIIQTYEYNKDRLSRNDNTISSRYIVDASTVYHFLIQDIFNKDMSDKIIENIFHSDFKK